MTIITLPRTSAPACDEFHDGFACVRAKGHGGRHATTFGGILVHVWGEDVHAERRVTSRVTAAFREIPRILRIETARTWDGVAQ